MLLKSDVVLEVQAERLGLLGGRAGQQGAWSFGGKWDFSPGGIAAVLGATLRLLLRRRGAGSCPGLSAVRIITMLVGCPPGASLTESNLQKLPLASVSYQNLAVTPRSLGFSAENGE